MAAALRDAGRLDVERPARPLDAPDWWYRAEVELPPAEPGEAVLLRLEGLATLAEVWLDDVLLLRSDNMFHVHEVDVTAHARGTHRLALRFRSVLSALRERRPRGRWRTRLVDQQQLRWVRTTLLGHMPGWCPPVPPVGPWRAVSVERQRSLSVKGAAVHAAPEGEGGVVHVALHVRALGAAVPREAAVVVEGHQGVLDCAPAGDGTWRIEGELRLDAVERWWPHTHGAPRLYGVRLAVTLTDGTVVALDAGRVGFRELALSTEGGGFALSVNGVPIFCRGACWTPLDVVSLGGSDAEFSDALDLARDAGMNMLRVSGPMVYEDDRFYEGCAERGILVWQDFMLASLDYPAEDDSFAASVEREAEQLLDRLQVNPSIAVLCGGSEVEQQAAMMGLPPEAGAGRLFEQVLPTASTLWRPDVPYWRASPGGGALPFHPNAGVSHYYGVGAYLRPLEDARRSQVRFTSECLAFSNVPEERTVERVLGDGESPGHHPKWKARVPRDTGPGWDFEDVRDHYLAQLFGVDPVRLRYADTPRYLALGRATSAEVMAATLAEWRRAGSTCRGALVWLYRDLLPGAGWGLVDATGLPKAAYYGVKRALQRVLLAFSDEGLNGLELHAVNDTASALEAQVELALYRDGEMPVTSARTSIAVPERSAMRLSADALLGRFVDTAYAYRFGPPGHDLAVATLVDQASGKELGTAFHFSHADVAAQGSDVGLEALAHRREDGCWEVRLRTKRFALSVSFDVPDHVPEDSYFHVAPGGERTVVMRPRPLARSFRGFVQALNATAPVRIELAEASVVNSEKGVAR
ncbi:MAG: hypothetical protein L0Y66_26550 [Myxococcaceae bacterium]|nr:hypothetical protein [Myxococcaceae bacterium]